MGDIPASYVRFLPVSKTTWGSEWDTTAATMQWIYRWWTCNLSFPCVNSLVSLMNETCLFFFNHEKINHQILRTWNGEIPGGYNRSFSFWGYPKCPMKLGGGSIGELVLPYVQLDFWPHNWFSHDLEAFRRRRLGWQCGFFLGGISWSANYLSIYIHAFPGWPLVGNEGINLYIGILGIHCLIPY